MSPDWSSRRMTTDSPCWMGMVERRTSMLRFLIRMLKRPSWGRRRSEMFRPAMSLRRETSALAMRFSFITCSWSTPSMRWRIRSTDSSGSMWMSEAPTCTASSKMVCKSLTTGALARSSLWIICARSKSVSASSSPSSSASSLISAERR